MSAKTQTKRSPERQRERDIDSSPEVEGKKQRSELALDITKEKSAEKLEQINKLDKEDFEKKANEAAFAKLELTEAAEKQKMAMYELAGTSIFELIPLLLNKRIDQKSIADGSAFTNPPGNMDTLLSVPNAQGQRDVRAAFEKLKVIFAEQGSFAPLSAGGVFSQHWEEMVKRGVEAHALTNKVLPATSSLSAPQKKLDEDKKEQPGVIESTWQYVKENPLKSAGYAALGTGLVIGGYYAVKGIWNWFKGSDEEKKPDEAGDKKEHSDSPPSSGGFFDGFWKVLAGGGLALAAGIGVGRLSETTAVRSWLKALNWDDAKIVEALRLFSHFEFAKAWGKLMEMFNLKEDPNMPVYKEIADKIKEATKTELDPKTIAGIANQNFNDYFPSDVLTSIQNNITQGATDLLKMGLRQIPLLGYMAQNDEQTKKDLETIARFLTLPECQAELQKNPPTPKESVLSVLARLTKVKIEAGDTDAQEEDLGNVAATGPAALEAARRAEEAKKLREKTKEGVKKHLQTNETLDEAHRTQVLEDTGQCLKDVANLEAANHSWYNDMSEEYRKFRGQKREQGEDTVDFVEALEALEGVDREILSKMRTHARDLQGKLNKMVPGQKLNKDELVQLTTEIDEFYKEYGIIKQALSNAEITGLNQSKLDAKKTWWEQLEGWHRAKAGATLVLYGIWGVPISILKGEDNNVIIDVFGTSVAAGATWEVGKLILSKEYAHVGKYGKALRAPIAVAKGAAKGVAAPIRMTSIIAEQYLFMEQKWLMKSVESGKLTVPEAIAKMEQYFESRGYEFKSGKDATGRVTVSVTENGIEKSLGQKAKGFFWKSKELNQPQSKAMAKQLAQLYELQNAGVETLRDGVLQGKMPPKMGIFAANDAIRFKNGSTFTVTEVVDGQVKGTLTLSDGTTQNGTLSTKKYGGVVTAENKFTFTAEVTGAKPVTLQFDTVSANAALPAAPVVTPVLAVVPGFEVGKEVTFKDGTKFKVTRVENGKTYGDVTYTNTKGKVVNGTSVELFSQSDGTYRIKGQNISNNLKNLEVAAAPAATPPAQPANPNAPAAAPANPNAPAPAPEGGTQATNTATGEKITLKGASEVLFKRLENANWLVVVALGVMSVKGISDIEAQKRRIEEERSIRIAEHPELKDDINAALDEQLFILRVRETMLLGQTSTVGLVGAEGLGNLLASEKVAPLAKQYFPRLLQAAPFLQKCGPVAMKAFVALGVLDLVAFNVYEMPQARHELEQLADTISLMAEQKQISPEELQATLTLFQEQKSFMNYKQVSDSIEKIIMISTLFMGSYGLAVMAALAPYAYMYHSALNVDEEQIRTSFQWAMKPRDVLLQDWITTGYERTAAESYQAVLHPFDAYYGNLDRQKDDTRSRIIDALLLKEGAPPAEFNARKNYIRAHLGPAYGCTDLQQAQQLISDSKTFARALDEIGQIPFEQLVEQQKLAASPEIIARLRTPEFYKLATTAYAPQDLRTIIVLKVAYERYREGVPPAAASTAPVPEHQETDISQWKSLHKGLYHLARFLGHTGPLTNETDLKNFFTADHAAERGVYWDEPSKSWYVNIDYGYDIPVGNSDTTIHAMIRSLQQHKDSVLADRNKGLTDGFIIGGRQNDETLSRKVDGMAGALQKGLEEVV